jgi:hypothetical protein
LPSLHSFRRHGCHADVFGQTDGRTMAAGASVTWMHCSVFFKVTWYKTRCVRADATMRPRLRPCPRGRSPASARTWVSARMHLPPLPSPSLPSPPLPSPLSLPPLYCPRGREKILKIFKKYFKKYFKFYFLVVVAGLERENFFPIFNFRFSIPKLPELPELRGLRGRSHEKKKVFSA